MKAVAYLVIGSIAFAALAFAAFWIWGTLAFTPTRIPVVEENAGSFANGARYTIERTSRGFTTLHRVVNYWPAGWSAPVAVLYVDGDRPRPVAARVVGDAVEVEFADTAAPVRVPLNAEGLPTEQVAYSRAGELTREPGSWLTQGTTP